MNFIQNVSMADVILGRHMDAGNRGVLIQIGDHLMTLPKSKVQFEYIHQFEFLDIDDSISYRADGSIISGSLIPEWEFRMREEQAAYIIVILKNALEEKRNVVVHCHAGICRSGAVAEVGEMMGFQPGGTTRIPNVWVKKLLMRELGWTYENN